MQKLVRENFDTFIRSADAIEDFTLNFEKVWDDQALAAAGGRGGRGESDGLSASDDGAFDDGGEPEQQLVNLSKLTDIVDACSGEAHQAFGALLEKVGEWLGDWLGGWMGGWVTG